MHGLEVLPHTNQYLYGYHSCECCVIIYASATHHESFGMFASDFIVPAQPQQDISELNPQNLPSLDHRSYAYQLSKPDICHFTDL